MNTSTATKTDYYKVFGVPSNAHPDTIKEIYKRRIRKLHPDKNPGISSEQIRINKQKLMELHTAYEVLSDPLRRAKYDSENANTFAGMRKDFDQESRQQVLANREHETWRNVNPAKPQNMLENGRFSIDKFNEMFEKHHHSSIPEGYFITDSAEQNRRVSKKTYEFDIDNLKSVPVKELRPRERPVLNPVDDQSNLQGFDLTAGPGSAFAQASEIAVHDGFMVDNDSGLVNREYHSSISDYAQAFHSPISGRQDWSAPLPPDFDDSVSANQRLKQMQQERSSEIAPVHISEQEHIERKRHRESLIAEQHKRQVESRRMLDFK